MKITTTSMQHSHSGDRAVAPPSTSHDDVGAQSASRLAGSPLTGARLVKAAFEAHAPDRVVSLAQSMFFELAEGRQSHFQEFDPQGSRTQTLGDHGVRDPAGLVSEMRERFEPNSAAWLYLSCVETALLACVSQMVEAHRVRTLHVNNAHGAYDDAQPEQRWHGGWLRKFVVATWPIVFRFLVLTTLSATAVIVFKSNDTNSLAQVFDKKGLFLTIGLGVLLTMMIGYGRDQWRALGVVRRSRTRDQAVLEAEKEEAIRIHESCSAMYEALERAWDAHAPAGAFKSGERGTLQVLEGNRQRIEGKQMPGSLVTAARDGGKVVLAKAKGGGGAVARGVGRQVKRGAGALSSRIGPRRQPRGRDVAASGQ